MIILTNAQSYYATVINSSALGWEQEGLAVRESLRPTYPRGLSSNSSQSKGSVIRRRIYYDNLKDVIQAPFHFLIS